MNYNSLIDSVADNLISYGITAKTVSNTLKEIGSYRKSLVTLIPNKALAAVASDSYVLRQPLEIGLFRHNSFFFGEKEALSPGIADKITNDFSLFKELFKRDGKFYSASREIGFLKCETDINFGAKLFGNFLKIGVAGFLINCGIDYFIDGEFNVGKNLFLAGGFALLPEILILI